MLLQSLRKADIVEVVKAVYRVPEGLVVFLLDEQVVVRVVDGLDVQLSLSVSNSLVYRLNATLTC